MTPEFISNSEKLFYDFLASHDHPLDIAINHDSSKFHYFKCPHGSATDSRYKFYSDGIPSGYLKCWKCQIEADFCSKQRHEVTQTDWQAHIDRMAECRHQNELETKQRHAEVARLSQAVFSIASQENASDHGYLRLKQVQGYGLRVLISEDATTQKVNCYKNTLLVPVHNINGELVNLERIYFDKQANKYQKRPLQGGQRNGAHLMLGEVIDPQGAILIGESYSTMASVFEAMGDYPCTITFNCGNIPHVVKLLRKKYPQSRLVITADDDKWHADSKLKHAGLKAAEKACMGIKNAKYLLPDFSVLGLSEEKLAELRPTDMNDLLVLLLVKGLTREAALLEIRQQIQQHSTQGNCMTENSATQTNSSKFNEKKQKDSELLLSLIDAEDFEFFHDEQQIGFCRFQSLKTSVLETRRLNDKNFKNYLSFIFRKEFKKTIADNSLREARSELEGRAIFDGKQKKIFLRVGELSGKIYIDLCDDLWRVVEISIMGWQILEAKNSPVYFERTQHMKPLPNPCNAGTGDVSKLWELINIPQEDQILVLAYIIDCFRCNTNFAILVLLGLQGAGKSFTQDIIRRFIDPNACNLRAAPRKLDDLPIDASTNYLVSYNNLSSLTPEAQDDLCGMSTGSGFARRTLYTDSEQTVSNICRPVILNGITNFVTRPDLLDRTITLDLKSIEEENRKTEDELKNKTQEYFPVIFGGLLDLLAKSLQHLPNIYLAKKPRMADFALMGCAVEKAQGFPDGTFINRYQKNRADAQESVIEASPVIQALIDYINDPGTVGGFWRGRPKDLLQILTDRAKPSNRTIWPDNAKGMGAALRRYIHPLKQFGIIVNEEPKGERGKMYRISKLSAVCTASAGVVEKPSNGGASQTEDGLHIQKDNPAHVQPSSPYVQPAQMPANPHDTYVSTTETVHAAHPAHIPQPSTIEDEPMLF